MPYKIEFTPHGERDFKKLDLSIAKRIKEKLIDLSQYPNPRDLAETIEGDYNTPIYSFHIGDYRALYVVEDVKNTVFIVRVGHRKNIYRQF